MDTCCEGNNNNTATLSPPSHHFVLGTPDFIFYFSTRRTNSESTVTKFDKKVCWIRIQYCTLKLTTVYFIIQDQQYMYLGTLLDTRTNLERKVSNLPVLAKAAGEVAGQLALRLVHDHLLRLSTEKYLNIMRLKVGKINRDVMSLQRVSCPELR